VLGIDATTNLAKVIQFHTLGDWPYFALIKKFMSHLHFPVGDIEVSISIGTPWSLPKPTPAIWLENYLLEKPIHDRPFIRMLAATARPISSQFRGPDFLFPRHAPLVVVFYEAGDGLLRGHLSAQQNRANTRMTAPTKTPSIANSAWSFDRHVTVQLSPTPSVQWKLPSSSI
jgi:hypothetical protein